MSKINLELQLKFLAQLDEALGDALSRYSPDSDEKVEELNYMREEVMRARKVVACRLDNDRVSSVQKKASMDYHSLAAQ
jgi:hypothetical protein